MTEYITSYLISLITLIPFILCYKKISNEKIEVNLLLIILILIGPLLSIPLLYLNNSFIKNLYTITFMSLLFKSISNKNFYELFYFSLIIWIYGLIVDLFAMLLVAILGLIEFLNIIYVQTILSIFVGMVLYIFCSIPVIKRFSKNTIEKLKKLKPYLILDITFIIILIYISTLVLSNIKNVSNIVIYIIIAIIVVYIIYIILDKHYNIRKFKELNNFLIKNNEFFIELDEEHRILKHNLIGKLLGIKSVANDKTKELIDDLILEYNKNYNIPNDIKNIPSGLNGLVYEKFYNFNNSEINLAIDNNIDSQLIDNLKPKVFNNLCEALSVIVDNALEASSKSEEKIVLINFEEDDNYYYININNTFNSNLDIDEFGSKNYSTKNINRGIGIFSILKRKDIILKNKIVNNCFISSIKIKKTIFN